MYVHTKKYAVLGNVLDSTALEKILLKLCENHLEWEWVETGSLEIFGAQKSEYVASIKNKRRGKCQVNGSMFCYCNMALKLVFIEYMW